MRGLSSLISSIIHSSSSTYPVTGSRGGGLEPIAASFGKGEQDTSWTNHQFIAGQEYREKHQATLRPLGDRLTCEHANPEFACFWTGGGREPMQAQGENANPAQKDSDPGIEARSFLL